MKDGFSITRRAEKGVFSWKESEREFKVWVENLEQVGDHGPSDEKKEYLYKNDGVLEFKEQVGDLQKCNEIEHYFPLDLAILNNNFLF